jgi:hypothetical protein
MIVGKNYISTGYLRKAAGGWWHLLVAVHRRWRLDFVRLEYPDARRRLYVGPFEIEWSH